ncbi:TorD/DmsD family molecular chaperone [Allochromatium palmeri]|uniref:Molecular chaperone TorD n=1 Tax=Allochromatium palmeri TaxID=231048 RepID=A0A6N8EGI5_9GAMM|nr:molecular chaperone TorD family protein [Allochromatium palmeri]MTW22188.1 molecular chaperone TorD [Allochromatium palmeri]
MMSNHDPSHLRRLAALLAMPEADALEALREIAEQQSWLAEPIAELESLPLEHWQAEHTRLFVSGYPKTPCPPFESAYRQGNMGGTTALDLQGLYHRAGLEAGETPPDYLGTQLEFAAYLLDAGQAEGSADCLAGALATELWDEHLSRWLPRFAQDLQAQTELVLYRRLGEQLAALCPQAPECADDA